MPHLSDLLEVVLRADDHQRRTLQEDDVTSRRGGHPTHNMVGLLVRVLLAVGLHLRQLDLHVLVAVGVSTKSKHDTRGRSESR